MSRVEARSGMDIDVRVKLMEIDLDNLDTQITGLRADITAQGDKVTSKLNKIIWAVMAATISFSASTVTFVLTLIVKK